jgi:hypothetical protein
MSDSLKWIKSTYSAQGNCVEVAAIGHVLIRDTQDRTGPVLKVSAAAWRAFTGQVQER